jgi:probable rRNA maturation factor
VRKGEPKLQLTISGTVGKSFIPFLRKNLRLAHRLAKSDLTELSIALVGDRKMGEVHLQFMNIPGPTDVLTFPLETDARSRIISGEIVICVPEARRRAIVEGVPLKHELLLYAIHGLLHLSGYDDRTDSQFRTMHRMEDKILTRLGIGSVFAPAKRRLGGRRSISGAN